MPRLAHHGTRRKRLFLEVFLKITNMIEKFPSCGNQTNYSFPGLLQDADERCAGGWDID
jgi:hypothetical protein